MTREKYDVIAFEHAESAGKIQKHEGDFHPAERSAD